MMGSKERDFVPLVNVSLEQLVPGDHFYRHLHKSLNLAFVRELVAPFYAAGGRPSIDPIVFFRLQLIMFFEGIRSERQLMRVAADRLSLRWYLGYDLHEPLPDHSSLTRIRDRYGVATFRRFFDQIVEQCRQAGLVWGKELYFDSTQVEANADSDAMLPRFYVEAMNEHLAALFPVADAAAGQSAPPTTADDAPPTLPIPINHTVAEQIQTDAAAPVSQDWVSRMGRQNREEKHGQYQRIADLRVSTTDPDATLTHTKGGSHLGYRTHYVVDGGKARIILTALVTPSEVMDNQPMLDLLWRVCFRWRLRPEYVCGDKKYGTVENIKVIEDAGIRAYMPLPDFDARNKIYGKQRFTYEAEADQYRCPEGQVLRFRGHSYGERISIYQAKAAICNACRLKAECTDSDKGRAVKRSFDEEYLDRVRSYYATAAYKKAIAKRKVWVEPLFGEGKQWHGLERFRLRGLEKVNIESLLIAAGQNLKRLLQKWGWGRRPAPNGAQMAVSACLLLALLLFMI